MIWRPGNRLGGCGGRAGVKRGMGNELDRSIRGGASGGGRSGPRGKRPWLAPSGSVGWTRGRDYNSLPRVIGEL